MIIYQHYKWYQIILPRLFGKVGKWHDPDNEVCIHFLLYKGKMFIWKVENLCNTDQDLKRNSQNG